jgi:hypothetical protein
MLLFSDSFLNLSKALKYATIYLILAPHDPEQHDMMLRFKQDKKIADIPSAE